MRTIKYAIFNKETNERVYTDVRRNKINEVMETLENKEKYEIRSKFFSI